MMLSIAFIFFFIIYLIHNIANALPTTTSIWRNHCLVKGVNNHCIQQQSKKFTTLFMQLNSTSASDLNSDMKAYIFVRDAERRQEEGIKENFKSLKDDMTKMEEKIDKYTKMVEENFKSLKDDMTKMEEKIDKYYNMVEDNFKSLKDDMTKMADDMKNIKLAVFVIIFVALSIQPDLRSLLAFIIKFFNILIYDYEFYI